MTSAAATTFCADKVGDLLWVDGNGKITAGNGTLNDPKPNAFSLVQIKDCPGATATCKASCYVHNLEKHAPETHALYVSNSRAVRDILSTGEREMCDWAYILAAYINDNCLGGFRWHVSGDIFSEEYARWIAMVCGLSLGVRHWIYTRSFNLIEPLSSCATVNGGNLSVNLSCDRNNYDEAVRVASATGYRLCYLSSDGEVPTSLRNGDVIFPDYSLRGDKEWFSGLPKPYKGLVCPVDYHGKSEKRRCGPCDRCLK